MAKHARPTPRCTKCHKRKAEGWSSRNGSGSLCTKCFQEEIGQEEIGKDATDASQKASTTDSTP